MAVRPDFRLSADNAPAVAKLVGRLDGLPLAIELVASRLRLLPVDQILSRLSARMLSSGSVDLPARQRTIESAITWSYELLAEPERKLFARFAIFSAGARLEEVEAVCGPPEELGQDVIDSLSTLVEQSLIRRVDDEERLRFRMLHVIQEFALERLTESGEAAALARRHLETYAAYVESVAPELLGRDRRMWLDVLEQDQDNLRAALDWAVESGESDLAFRLSSAAWRLWQARGHLHEARRRLDEVLALEGGDPRNRAKALEALGGILWWQSDLDGALEIYRETVRMHRILGDPRELANALYNVSLATVFVQDTSASRDALDEAEVLYRELGDVGGLGDVEWGARQFHRICRRRCPRRASFT